MIHYHILFLSLMYFFLEKIFVRKNESANLKIVFKGTLFYVISI